MDRKEFSSVLHNVLTAIITGDTVTARHLNDTLLVGLSEDATPTTDSFEDRADDVLEEFERKSNQLLQEMRVELDKFGEREQTAGKTATPPSTVHDGHPEKNLDPSKDTKARTDAGRPNQVPNG